MTFKRATAPALQHSWMGEQGWASEWHLVHYGFRTGGGAGLIAVESAAAGPHHRATSAELGI